MLNELDQKALNEFTKWKEVKQKLKTDPRYKAINSKTERERMFFEHVTEVLEERKRRYGNIHKRGFGESAAPNLTGESESEPPPTTKKDDMKVLYEIFHDHITQLNVGQPAIGSSPGSKPSNSSKKTNAWPVSSSRPSACPTPTKNTSKAPSNGFLGWNRQERAQKYKELLVEKKEINYKSKYEETKKYLETDARCLILPKYERQNLFNEYIQELEDNIKAEYRKMLKESNYISKDSSVEDPHFSELVKVLRAADLRFRKMDSFAPERDQMLKDYILSLRTPSKKH